MRPTAIDDLVAWASVTQAIVRRVFAVWRHNAAVTILLLLICVFISSCSVVRVDYRASHSTYGRPVVICSSCASA